MKEKYNFLKQKKWKKFVANKPALKEMFKEVHHREEIEDTLVSNLALRKMKALGKKKGTTNV